MRWIRNPSARSMTWELAAAILSIAALYMPSARAQCPATGAPVQIEALPFTETRTVCNSSVNTVNEYAGFCSIPRTRYSQPEVIYKVSLHPGNKDVEFRVNSASADLVLALLSDCGDGMKCVNNSPDHSGPGLEVMPKPNKPYPPGIYFLNIDSDINKVCSYTLTVTGVNPVPDLVVNLTSTPKPVIAGLSLTYTLSVKNVGALAATGAKVTVTFPAGVTVPTVPGCPPMGPKKIACTIGALAKNEVFPKTIAVKVDPSTRGSLSTTAIATANEGDQNPADNQKTDTTNVKAESALTLTKAASSGTAIAGVPLVYTLKVHNTGPSDATSVVVTDVLPSALSFVSALGCQFAAGTVTCTIPTLAAGATAERAINVTVKPSAGDGSQLANDASVSAVESGPGFTTSSVTTPVVRRTHFSVTKTAPASVAAGEELTYDFTVCNCGPSDSSGATLTDELASLPPEVRFLRSNDCTSGDGRKVICPVGPVSATLCQANGQCASSAAKRLSFVAGVASSLLATTLVNSASIKAIETDPNPVPSNSAATQVTIKADLAVAKSALRLADLAVTDSAVAGDNLAYALTVTNAGPSDSHGATLNDTLAPGLSFVASANSCAVAGSQVTCPVPPVPANQSYVARFVVKLPADATGTLVNKASVTAKAGEADPQPGNNTSASISTVETQKADLAVALSGSPDPVDLSSSHDVLYTVQVTNAGPSNVADVDIVLTLPAGGSVAPDPASPCVSGESPAVAKCTLPALLAGASQSFEIHGVVPDQRGPVTASAAVSATTTDPNLSNNTATMTTTLAAASDADILVTKTARVEAVVAGDLIPYTIEVVNRGPASAPEVLVLDHQPNGTTFLSGVPGCLPSSSPAGFYCPLGTLAKGDRVVLSPIARVDFDFPGLAPPGSPFLASPPMVINTAAKTAALSGPNPANGSSTATTPVLQVAPLVLPFFKADAVDVTTLLAVRNPSDQLLGVRLDYFLAGQSAAASCENQCLEKKATLTRNLRDRFPGPGLTQGHVSVTPIAFGGCQGACDPKQAPALLTPSPVPPLGGDFIRVEPASGNASGQLLVSTDTSRSPAELCRHWSVRFLNGGSFGGNTELFFFVPGNPGGSDPVAKGKVFDESGQFVQEISITDAEQSFLRTTQAGFDHSVPLLASFGSIEWEFPNGVGNVSAILRAQGGFTVSVPGVCRRSPSAEDLGPEPPLIVPYFEVQPGGATTLFAVRNEAESDILVGYEYFSGNGTSLRTESLTLKAHATRTVNLQDIPELQGATGYVKIGAAGGAVRHQRILSGDFERIDPAQGLASGGALVDTDLHRSPPQLCRSWNVRFLQGGAQNATTDVVFFLGSASSGQAAGVIYSEAGGNAVGQPLKVTTDRAAFQISGLSLGLSGAGAIDWDLGKDVVGNVATIIRAGGLSVLVPGLCNPGS